MMGARGGLADARIIAELESLLGKRPDKKNRAVRWSDLEALRKSIIKAGGAGTLDGVAPEGDGETIPSIPGSVGERLAERLRLAEREIEAAEREAGAAREAAQNAMSALANAGTVYRAANIVTLPDGSRTAGIEAFVWDDEGGGTGSAVLLHGDQVMAPGTLSANTLVAGFGNNLLQNTRFYDGMLHWFKGGNGEVTGAVREAGQSYAHPSFRTLMLFQNGTSSSEAFLEYLVQQEGTTTRIVGAPCQPEKWYGASVYLCPLRCAGVIEIRFFNAAGQLIDGAQRATSWADRASSSTIPDLWDRAFVKAQAPAGAAYVSIRVRKRGTNAGSPNSYLFIWKPMIEETHANATAPGAYASNETSMMTGDMIFSRSILGRHLTTEEAVITGKAQMGEAVVGSAQIEQLAVQTGNIAELAVETFKLADRSVSIQWSSNSDTLTINPAYPMELVVFALVQVRGAFNTYTSAYRLYRNDDRIDGAAFSVSPYTTPMINALSLTVPAGIHTFRHEYDGSQGDYTRFRTIVIGFYK